MRSPTIHLGFSLLALLPLLAPAPLEAQSPASGWLDASVRVRRAALLLREGERFPELRQVQGTLLEARGDTLRLGLSGGRDVLVVLDDDSVLERRGPVPAKVRGRWIGLLGGAAVGALYGYTTFEPHYVSGCSLGEALAAIFGPPCTAPDRQSNDIERTTLWSGVLGGLLGVFVGGLVGGQFETDGWVGVGRSQIEVMAGAGPAGRGVGAGLRFSF